jgi:hypothetical protein
MTHAPAPNEVSHTYQDIYASWFPAACNTNFIPGIPFDGDEDDHKSLFCSLSYFLSKPRRWLLDETKSENNIHFLFSFEDRGLYILSISVSSF